MEWSKNEGTWSQAGGDCEPQSGDMIMFDWGNTRSGADHVGIVVSYDSSTGVVTTVEGNSGSPGAVRVKTYDRNQACVMGYISPNK